jgi:hypothetical protein
MKPCASEDERRWQNGDNIKVGIQGQVYATNGIENLKTAGLRAESKAAMLQCTQGTVANVGMQSSLPSFEKIATQQKS